MKKDISLIVSRIKSIAKGKKISMRSLANQLGMTPAGFHRSLENGSLKVSTLCEISDILEVELHDFVIDLTKVGDKSKEEWGGMVEFQTKMIGDYTIEIKNLEKRLKILETKNEKSPNTKSRNSMTTKNSKKG